MIKKNFYKNGRKNQINGSFLIMIFLSVSLIIQNSPNLQTVEGSSGSFNEDFTTTTYLDGSNTTAEGWGDGNIFSPKKSPTFVGSCPSPGYLIEVFVDGDYAYVAEYSSGFLVVDISNPASPTIAGSCTTAGAVYEVIVEGNYAYLAVSTSGVQVIDITDPTSPSPVGHYDTIWYDVRGIAISGNYLYATISNFNYGFYVFDISDPTNPTFVTSIITDYASDVYVSGNYAYITTQTSPYSLKVVNINNPSTPSVVGTCSFAGRPNKISVDGDYAYIVDEINDLHVIDISNPSSPYSVATYGTSSGNIVDVTVEGNYVFVATGSSLQVVDISNPSAPSFAGIYDPPSGMVAGVDIAGNYAFIATSIDGLHVVSISDYVSPSLTATCDTPVYAYDVSIAGDYAYVADGSNGLQVIDISDPSSPYFVGSSSTDDARAVYVEGNYAYVADYQTGLYVFDISNPTNPIQVGHAYAAFYGYDIWVSGDYAFLAQYSWGVRVYDISDPTNPTFVDDTTTLGRAYGIHIAGDYAYFADYSSGLTIMDISNPTNPFIVANVDTPGYAYGIFVEGNYAYLAEGNLRVFDISDPTNPFQVDYMYAGSPEKIHVSGNYLYAASPSDGQLDVYDITNPASISYITAYTTPGNARGLTIEGDYAFVADGSIGLTVIEIKRNRARQYVSSCTAQSTAVYTGLTSSSLERATLTALDLRPTGTTITYYLSPDNGNHWEQVTLGVEHYFSNTGYQLKLRAVLSTTDSLETPSISSIAISYATILNSPSLISPDNAYMTDDTTPIFEWSSVGGTSEYLIQIDTTTSFNSPFINETVPSPSTSYTPILGLGDGTWYWRMAAIDVDGDLGVFSAYRSLFIDSNPPDINQPNDITYEQESTGYDITWSTTDLFPDYYNITKDGSIEDEGVWLGNDISINVDGLSLGTYTYVCSVYDEIGHSATDTVIVSVEDTSYPFIDQLTNITYAQGTTGNNITWHPTDSNPNFYTVIKDDSELVASGSWDGSTIIVYIDDLDLGTHKYNCTVYDIYSLSDSSVVYVIVVDTTLPIIDSPNDVLFDMGTTGHYLTWNPYDFNPDYYTIILDGTTLIANTSWDGNQITINIDSTPFGSHNYLCTVYDISGKSASDLVIVDVDDLSAPTVNSPEDIEYGEGTTGHNITWIALDYSSYMYQVYRNGIEIESDIWISGSPIIIEVDALSVGIYNFTIVFQDIYDHSIIDIVFVIVIETIPEFTPLHSLLSFMLLSILLIIYAVRKKTKFNKE